jgi:hypothetical protein
VLSLHFRAYFLRNGVDNFSFIFAPLDVYFPSHFSGRFVYVCYLFSHFFFAHSGYITTSAIKLELGPRAFFAPHVLLFPCC